MDFSVKWNLSTRELVSGWKTELFMCEIPHIPKKASVNSLTNTEPLSVNKTLGYPSLLNTCSKPLTIESEFGVFRGIASAHKVYGQIKVNRYLYPVCSVSGKGPTMSARTLVNGSNSMATFVNGAFVFCSPGLEFLWQGSHVLQNSWQFLSMFGQ